jgi:hypothetical protein
MTISGAAASANVGYYTSPLVRLVLTLFNARLGTWLGNPGRAGDRTFHLAYPNFSVGPMIAEAFGLADDRYPYVNLSDGRHFESLGLYEMVLRRCHYIVVCDGGRDPEFSLENLGRAVRKVQIELGIPIEFDDIKLFPRSDDEDANSKGRHCAVGRIRYSALDGAHVADGLLIYVKPAWYGKSPPDILEYSRRNKAFPHEPGSDRFFTEAEFETYRRLGAYTMEKLCPSRGGDFRNFLRTILSDHLNMAESSWPRELLELSP